MRIATPGRAAGRGTGGRIVTPKLQISGVFSAGTTALDPKDYYTPGNESPAVSTADYYHMHACQFLRPYDLDAMGSAGAAVKAANGNNRYVWFMAAEHPGGGGGIWRDSMGFKIGFSDDPGVLPPVAIEIIPGNNQFAGGPSIPNTTGYTLTSDMAPSSLVYNPDDASYPFYLYTQGFPHTGSLGTQSIMWKSSNMFDWVGGAWGPKNIDEPSMAAGVALTSFQTVERRGTGDWISYGVVGNMWVDREGVWTSTDGKTFTYNTSTIVNVSGYPTVNLTIDGGSAHPTELPPAPTSLVRLTQERVQFSTSTPTMR